MSTARRVDDYEDDETFLAGMHKAMRNGTEKQFLYPELYDLDDATAVEEEEDLAEVLKSLGLDPREATSAAQGHRLTESLLRQHDRELENEKRRLAEHAAVPAASEESDSESTASFVTCPTEREPTQKTISTHPHRIEFRRKPDGSLEVWQRKTEAYKLMTTLSYLNGPDRSTAFATLTRGPNHPLIFAVRGHPERSWTNIHHYHSFTKRAMKLRERMGLEKKRLYASHVEQQLVAYLFYKYSVWRGDGMWAGVCREYNLHPVISVHKGGICGECSEFLEMFDMRYPGFDVTVECDKTGKWK